VLISVVVPTYNNAAYITQALDSVFAQSFTDYEVVVVDDGSVDDTRAVLSRYGARIRYHYQENQGLAVARNTGLRLAAGRYLTYLDADDVWEVDNLLVKARVLEANQELGGVFSEFTIFDDQGVREPRGTRQLFPFFARTGLDLDDIFSHKESLTLPDGTPTVVRWGQVFDKLFWGNFILPTSMLFSRAGAAKIGEFLPELRTQQDYEFWLRFTKTYPLAHVDAPLVRYRRHPAQLTDQSRIENIMNAVRRIIDRYEDEFARMGRQREFGRRKAGILTELAKVKLGQGRPAEARALLTASLRLNPAGLESYTGLALSLMPPAVLAWARGRR
jgi:glycosyltransferase involved in cell wall biosynthesis